MLALRTTLLAGIGLGLAAVSPAAAAIPAFVTVAVNEWAGPSADYPVVLGIPAGATVTMFGCLPEATWCDISFYGARGWVPGQFLQAYYGSEVVAVPYYVTRIGVPVVSFDFDTYWGDYYRDRPFYREHDRFWTFAHRGERRDVYMQDRGDHYRVDNGLRYDVGPRPDASPGYDQAGRFHDNGRDRDFHPHPQGFANGAPSGSGQFQGDGRQFQGNGKFQGNGEMRRPDLAGPILSSHGPGQPHTAGQAPDWRFAQGHGPHFTQGKGRGPGCRGDAPCNIE